MSDILLDRRRLMFGDGRGCLPYGYRELDSILTNQGRAYINTLIMPQTNRKYIFEAQYIGEGSGGGTTMGGCVAYTWTKRFYFFVDGMYVRLGTGGSSIKVCEPGERIRIELTLSGGNASVYNGRTTTNFTFDDISNGNKIFLGGYNANSPNNSQAIFLANCRLCYFSIEEGAQKLIELIPCIRNSDGKIGMYDLCGTISPTTNSSLYASASSYEFIR